MGISGLLHKHKSLQQSYIGADIGAAQSACEICKRHCIMFWGTVLIAADLGKMLTRSAAAARWNQKKLQSSTTTQIASFK